MTVKVYSALRTNIVERQPYASPNTVELVLASDYGQLADNKRLREALETMRAMFPAGITKQVFRFGGLDITADGDDEFLSCKKVEAWAAPLLAAIDAALSPTANGEGEG